VSKYLAYTLEELLEMVNGTINLMRYPEHKWGVYLHETDTVIGRGADPKHAVVEAILWQRGKE